MGTEERASPAKLSDVGAISVGQSWGWGWPWATRSLPYQRVQSQRPSAGTHRQREAEEDLETARSGAEVQPRDSHSLCKHAVSRLSCPCPARRSSYRSSRSLHFGGVSHLPTQNLINPITPDEFSRENALISRRPTLATMTCPPTSSSSFGTTTTERGSSPRALLPSRTEIGVVLTVVASGRGR